VRLFILLFAAFIIAVVWDSTSVCLVANADDSATFEWTDDKGTVTFSDNPMQIPDKYNKRVKKRATVKGETPQVRFDQNSSPIRRQPTQKAEIYGGHDEGWWRGQFSGTRTEIERIKVELESKQQNLKALHYKKVISNSSQTDGIFGNPRKNKENYRVAYDDIREDEKMIKVLDQKLIELENEAARYGVPLEWRR
jgi:hypothetical protein